MDGDSAGTQSPRVEGTPGERGELGTPLRARALLVPVPDNFSSHTSRSQGCCCPVWRRIPKTHF